MKAGKVFLILLLLILAGTGVGTLFIWKEQKAAEEKELRYQQMRQQPDLLLSSEEKAIPVEFEKWQEINPEIYAWITIPGTAIDAPVLQSRTDNSYYLTRSAQGEESLYGAIFSEDYNRKDFSDVHTVLYGQSAGNGTVFADLHSFGDETFFREHRMIAVYTPDAVRCYRIFAAYLYDDRHLLLSFDCTNSSIFQAYVKEILGQRNLLSQIDTGIQIQEGDRLLTLSTDHSKGAEYRYLVQAVLTDEVFVN